MKITLLLTQSLESPSGLGRYWPLSRELARLGHEIRIAALHPNLSALDQYSYTEDGVNITYVAPMHVKKVGNEKSYYPLAKLIQITAESTIKLSQTAINSPGDILFIAKPHPMNSIAGVLGGKLAGKWISIDCDDYEAESNRFSSSWQNHIITWFERNIPRQGRLITTNTYFMRDKLLRWGVPSEHILYLPNGIDRDRFRPPEKNSIEELKYQLGVSGKKVIAYIGSLSLPSHPVDLLIEAFRIIHEIQPNSLLLLVGGGEDYKTLNQQIHRLGLDNAVIFCGQVEPDQVPTYFQIADVSVEPVHENDAARGRCPLKLFESWACEVPFVTADVGDRRRLLGSPPAGCLAQPGDPHSLAQAIQAILENPPLAAEFRQRGKDRVKDYYWDTLIIDLEAAFKHLLQV